MHTASTVISSTKLRAMRPQITLDDSPDCADTTNISSAPRKNDMPGNYQPRSVVSLPNLL